MVVICYAPSIVNNVSESKPMEDINYSWTRAMKRVYQALGTGKLFFVTWFLSIAFDHYYIQRSLDVLAYIRNIDRKIARRLLNPLPSSGLINIRCIYITSMPWLINPIYSTIIVIFIWEWQSNNNKHIYLW